MTGVNIGTTGGGGFYATLPSSGQNVRNQEKEPKGCSSRTWEIVDKILQQITEEESNLAANQVLSRQHRNNVNVHLWGIG